MTYFRVLRAILSFIVGFGIGFLAIYTAEILNISPMFTAIPALALSLLWVSFISELKV